VQSLGCQPQVRGQVFRKVPSGAATISLLSSCQGGQVYLGNAELQTEGMEYPSALEQNRPEDILAPLFWLGVFNCDFILYFLYCKGK